MFSWKEIHVNTINVFFMSICLCVLFTADSTMVNMEKIIISSISDDNEEFHVDGYDLLAILYISFGVFLWLGPSFISLIGLRTCMAVASLIYTIYIFSFSIEQPWAVYASSAIGGIGAGMLWAAEGKYLVSNSTPTNVSRNIGIFWTFMSSSAFIGNIFVYFKLRDKTYVDRDSRHWIIYTLSVIALIATILFALLRPPKKNEQVEMKEPTTAFKELKRTWKVFITKEMILLCITFCFTGLQQSFNSGIYSSSIGFTLQFGNKSKQMVPLSGLLIGLGQLLAGGWQMLQGTGLSQKAWARRGVLMVGVIGELLSFSLIFINIPSSAVFGNTNDTAIINSNIYIALFCSLLLGFGDGCLNTQNFTIIAVIFPDASAQSCALYKFVKAVSVAGGYAISSHFNLYIQLGILATVGVSGLIAFFIVDIAAVKTQNNVKETISIK